VNLLLDTHALIWWIGGGERLGRSAVEAISDPTSVVFASAASVWEIAIKRAKGKLKAPPGLGDELLVHGFAAVPITVEHAERAGELPRHHGDPFDRMLVAQAQVEGLVLVTRDPAIAAYDVQTLGC
jgi:PIN domain nuclease of toxin-antitoxin system